LGTESENLLSLEERQWIIEGICYAVNKMIEKIITEKSPKNRAKSWSLPHSQSHKRLAFDSMMYNLMSGKQQVPARPRDFRLNLAPQESEIDSGELFDGFAKLVAFHIGDAHRNDFPFPRGKPKQAFSSERRGRNSYYDYSELKNIVHEFVTEPQMIELISERLLANEKLFSFLKYSFCTVFYQAKENPQEFLNSFRPYGLNYKQLELNSEKPGPWLNFSDMSTGKLEELAGSYTRKSIQNFQSSNIPIFYEVAIILQMIVSYE